MLPMTLSGLYATLTFLMVAPTPPTDPFPGPVSGNTQDKIIPLRTA